MLRLHYEMSTLLYSNNEGKTFPKEMKVSTDKFFMINVLDLVRHSHFFIFEDVYIFRISFYICQMHYWVLVVRL